MHHLAEELLAKPVGEAGAEALLADGDPGLEQAPQEHQPNKQGQPLLKRRAKGEQQGRGRWAARSGAKQQGDADPQAGDVEQTAQPREQGQGSQVAPTRLPGQLPHQRKPAQAGEDGRKGNGERHGASGEA